MTSGRPDQTEAGRADRRSERDTEPVDVHPGPAEAFSPSRAEGVSGEREGSGAVRAARPGGSVAERTKRPERSRSFRWHLGALCLAVLLPTLLFVGVVLWRYAVSERARVEAQAAALARNLATTLDLEVNGVLTTVQALATSPSLQTRDLPAFYGQAEQILRLQGVHISLRDNSGRVLLTTRVPLGTTFETTVPAVVEADRGVLRTGAPAVSSVYTGAVSGRPTFQIVAAPVSVAGTPTYVLGASLDLDYLAEAVRKTQLPAGWSGTLVDRTGTIAARSERHGEHVGRPAPTDFRGEAGDEGGSRYGRDGSGQDVLVGFARSFLTGWTASAALSADAVAAPLRRSLGILGGLGIVLALIATAAALAIARRVNRAVNRLVVAAEAIGVGREPGRLATSIVELNRVGRVMASSAGQLRDREERLRLVIEGAKGHAILTTDPAGLVTSWSAGSAAIFGWTAGEILGRPASVLFTPEDLAAGADVEEFATASRDGLAVDERWHLRKDGSRVFMNGSVHPLPPDAQGRGQGFIKVARDETERRRADEALRRTNQTLEGQVVQRTRERDRVWRNSQDLQAVIDTRGMFRAVNPAATAILGWTADEMVGRSVFDFIVPEDVEATTAALAQASHDALPSFENRYRHKDGGARRLSWVAAPDGELIYASGRDVTAQHEGADALRRVEDALRQSQKMEAVGQLTGGIAHDFNNLLAGIVGSLDLMQTRIAQGRTDTVERYAKAAMGSAQRAAALTHRLLAFSRRQPLDPRPVDANALVAGMEDLLRRTIGPLHALEIVAAGGLWATLCDPNQLENALLNLAINARDAMPKGGRLTVETRNAHLDDAYAAQQGDVAAGQYVCICVTDTGTGMPADVAARAFEPFFTTKPLGQGTGLGLSMAYGFTKQSGGHLKIYSEEGLGTSVKIYLPRHRGEIEPAGAHPVSIEAPRAEAGQTVLVVEDEPVVRSLVGEVLGELGYRVIEAPDGPSGLKVLQSDERVDLVVSDVGLPGLNGRQLVDQAREGRPGLKALFITGYAENATLANGFLEPGMEMITKPFAVDLLATKVSAMLRE